MIVTSPRPIAIRIFGYAVLCLFCISSSLAADDMPIKAAIANKAMQRGMNYGNIFDQLEKGKYKEGAWVTLKAADLQKMADLYYQKGFRNFRIPFTWTDCADLKTGEVDFSHKKVIKYKALLDYILKTYPDAYVILNTHHDKWYPGWDGYKKGFATLWMNVAKHFEGYSYRLIFEIDNEPFHGIKGNFNKDLIEMMTIGWNAIRGTGGRNTTRLIMLTPVGGAHYRLKTDYPDINAVNKVTGGNNDYAMMTVHFYGPWNYAGRAETASYDKGKIVRSLAAIAAWSKKTGIPVNIGEFGVSWREKERYPDKKIPNDLLPKQLEWYRTVVDAMIDNNLSFSVWDDNGWFRVLDRKTFAFASSIKHLEQKNKGETP